MKQSMVKMRKCVVTILVISLFLSVFSFVPRTEAYASTVNVETHRVYGSNRYETAISIADELAKGKGYFDCIIVASGGGYPDALSGGYLAKVKNAPILLVNTNKEEQIASYIASHLRTGGTVYLLGGSSAVSENFENKLKQININPVRLGGANRYETNRLILEEAGIENQDVLICTGTGYADSLSAASTGKPILLVNKELASYQQEILRKNKVKSIYVIGGVASVNQSIFNAASRIATTTRLGGSNRYETSTLIASAFFGKTHKNVVLASGQNFPDGLAGGPLALSLNAPVILVPSTGYPGPAKNYINEHGCTVAYILGGESAVSDYVAEFAMERYNDDGLATGSGTAGGMIEVMRSWLGYSEANGKHKIIIDIYNSMMPLPSGYKMSYYDAWCDATISAAAIKAGCVDLIGRECSVPRHVTIFKQKGIWQEDGTITPRRGDIIVYNWSQFSQPNNWGADHIGIVESVIGNKITVIEGNHSNAVGRRTIPVGWGYIRGYAQPKYKTVSDSVSEAINLLPKS